MHHERNVNGMDEWKLLAIIRERYQRILSSKLTGIYVHGSLAFGCFRRECSDIDFLVVVEQPLVQAEKELLIQTLLELDCYAPPKGFEMSVVLRSACSPFADPTPFELHYSNAHRINYQCDLAGTCLTLQGFDPDLAAHMTVVQAVGIALCGEPVDAVFAPVPKASYLRSIWYDIESAPENMESDPVYYVLNLCRALSYTEEGLVLSKEQGGKWGASHLPEDSILIQAALEAYQQGTKIPPRESLRSFAEKMLLRICQSADFLSCGIKKH